MRREQHRDDRRADQIGGQHEHRHLPAGKQLGAPDPRPGGGVLPFGQAQQRPKRDGRVTNGRWLGDVHRPDIGELC